MLAPSSLAVESRNESWFDGEERTRETLAFRRELGVMRRLANYSDFFCVRLNRTKQNYRHWKAIRNVIYRFRARR